jgi:hypothetical protein
MGLTFRREDTVDELFAKFASDPKATELGNVDAGKDVVGKERKADKNIELAKLEKSKEVDQQQIDQERKKRKILK